ncbi:MAG: hypothetical protein CSYNP_04030 [Syntrophus sp. SKADARSKE-3]|nr:hypothetical protein [Syntrophus sp. SKADARSKE-3]
MNIDGLVKKVANPVIPAKGGMQNLLERLDSGFHRNDQSG